MTNVHGFARVLLVALGALAFAGCSPKPSAVPSGGTASQTAKPATRAASQGVAVGEDLAKICKLSLVDVEKAPKFDYEQADLSGEDRDVLDQIAKCVTMGPLKGRALKLIGRADPRGESEYNMGLGGRRADSVRTYLSQLGVDGRKIAETSRGELDATGKDESGWRRDRRVDVLLQ